MQILLPPSEGKHIPDVGPALKLSELSFAAPLLHARKISLGDDPTLVRAPAAAAHDIYSGVLYSALDWETLNAASRTRANRSIIIISARFGALRLTDRIPTYKARIENSEWREPVTAALGAIKTPLWIDCRSSTYQQVFRPPVDRTVAVRVFKQTGKHRTVITHMSKHYRGLLTRMLVTQSRAPKSPQELLEVAATVFDCELTPSKQPDPWFLDLIINSS